MKIGPLVCVRAFFTKSTASVKGGLVYFVLGVSL